MRWGIQERPSWTNARICIRRRINRARKLIQSARSLLSVVVIIDWAASFLIPVISWVFLVFTRRLSHIYLQYRTFYNSSRTRIVREAVCIWSIGRGVRQHELSKLRKGSPINSHPPWSMIAYWRAIANAVMYTLRHVLNWSTFPWDWSLIWQVPDQKIKSPR